MTKVSQWLIVVVLLVIVSGVFSLIRGADYFPVDEQSPVPQIPGLESDWLTYRNEKYGFSIDYLADSIDQPEYDYFIDTPGSGGRRLGPYLYIRANPVSATTSCLYINDFVKEYSSTWEATNVLRNIQTSPESDAEAVYLTVQGNHKGGTAGGKIIIARKTCMPGKKQFYLDTYDSGFNTRSELEKENYFKAISTIRFEN